MKELELILKKMSLKKEALETSGNQLKELAEIKDKISKKELKQCKSEIMREYKKSLKRIDQLKN